LAVIKILVFGWMIYCTKLFLAATTLVMLKETHINSLSEIHGKSFVVFRKYKSSCVFAEISALFVYVKCTPCGLFWRL